MTLIFYADQTWIVILETRLTEVQLALNFKELKHFPFLSAVWNLHSALFLNAAHSFFFDLRNS